MTARLILSAGISRSGSTWLFNATRLLLLASGQGRLEAAWVEDYDPKSGAKIHLVKLHEPAPEFLMEDCQVLTSHRDLRDIAASIRRMKWTDDDDALLAFLDGVVAQHRYWSSHASYEMTYEAMVRDAAAEVTRLAQALAIALEGDAATRIASEIDALRHDPASPDAYDRVSLLHHDHRASAGESNPAKTLPPALVERIERRHADWLTTFGYL